MALSNIFREPRREITETLVGVGVVILPVYVNYRLGAWSALRAFNLGMCVLG